MVVYASKLAGVAGMHPYVSQDELRREFEFVRDGSVVDAAGEGKGDGEGERYVPPELAVRRTVDALPDDARRLVRETLERAPAMVDAREVERSLAGLVDAEGVTPEAVDVVRRELYTCNGTRCEDAIREATQAERATRIVKDDRFRVSREPWLTVGDTAVYLGGRFDGYDAERREVVEIKTRQRRHLGAPLYERVQLHAYSHICGVRDARLVESYLGQRREHAVPFDDALWAEVSAASERFLRQILLPPTSTPTPRV
jgi:hypothetical protein